MSEVEQCKEQIKKEVQLIAKPGNETDINHIVGQADHDTESSHLIDSDEKHNVGLKFDTDKLRYDLIPPEVTEELAKVITYGAKKYAENNWQKVEPFNDRYYAALMRHLEAWRKGEKCDPESGLNHLSHVLTNVSFLLWRDLKDEM